MTEKELRDAEAASRERWKRRRELDNEDMLPEAEIQAMIRKADEATARERAKPAVVAV